MKDTINTYTTIASYPKEKYKLSALFNDGKYDMASLDFNGEMWDNDLFLFGDLYKTISAFINDKKVTKEFEDIIQSIPLSDFQIILDMLDKGIELGFNSNT